MEKWNSGMLVYEKDNFPIYSAEGGPSTHHSRTHYSIFPAFQYSIGATPLNSEQEV